MWLIEWITDELKRFGRKLSFANFGTLYKFTGVAEETTKKSIRIAGVPPEYGSRALPLGQPTLCLGTYHILR